MFGSDDFFSRQLAKWNIVVLFQICHSLMSGSDMLYEHKLMLRVAFGFQKVNYWA